MPVSTPRLSGRRISFDRLRIENIYIHFKWNNDPELNRLDSEAPYSPESFGAFKKRFERMARSEHPHNRDRGSFVTVDGVVQPGPAPRFSRTPGSVKGGPPDFGAQTESVLAEWGFDADEIASLRAANAIGRHT